MPGDEEILRVFEIADDQLISILGYFLYVQSCERSTTVDEILNPSLSSLLPVARIGYRRYDQQIMVASMKNLFIYYHISRCFVAMVDVFASAVEDFVRRLAQIGKPQKVKRYSYKHYLKWILKKFQTPNMLINRW